jgi:hypothetical protein
MWMVWRCWQASPRPACHSKPPTLEIQQSLSILFSKPRLEVLIMFLLVDAYRDSQPSSPGVIDALSGPSAIMAVAKAMMECEFKPKNKIIFLLYSGFQSGKYSGFGHGADSIPYN